MVTYPSEWEEYPFGQFFKTIPNNTLSRDKLSEFGQVGNIHYGDVLIKYGDIISDDDDIPRIKEDIGYVAQNFLNKKDVIIADTAEDETVGKVSQIGDVSIPLVGGLHTVVCRPMVETADDYLGIYMNSRYFHDQLIPYITGIKVSSVSKKSLNKTKIIVPASIREQTEIVKVFRCFDDYINNLTELIEKKKWIRDGTVEDLVSGQTRIEGFHGNWKEVNLLECVSLVQGLTYTPDNVKAYGTLVLRSSNIQEGELSLEDNVYVIMPVPREKMIRAGDILVCVRNGSSALIGKSCVLPKMLNTSFGAFMSVLRGDKTGFISRMFASSIVQNQIRNRSSATINQITKKDFESIQFFLPSIEEQIAIVNVLSSMDEEIYALEDEREKIIQIREGAMDDLLTGRVRLPMEGE